MTVDELLGKIRTSRPVSVLDVNVRFALNQPLTKELAGAAEAAEKVPTAAAAVVITPVANEKVTAALLLLVAASLTCNVTAFQF